MRNVELKESESSRNLLDGLEFRKEVQVVIQVTYAFLNCSYTRETTISQKEKFYVQFNQH